MNRNSMYLGAIIPLLMAVSCANPPLKTAQTRALGETPTIVSIEPANGAVGIQKDANIIVTFSQPMNTLETEAAYSSVSPELDAANVTFSWSADQTVLTINPNSDLAYSTGGNPNTVVATQYDFSISDLATDIEASELSATNSSFKTFKFIQAKIFAQLMDTVITPAYDPSLYVTLPGLNIGDGSSNENLRGLVEFNLSSLPLTLDSNNIQSAIAKFAKNRTIGSPYKKLKLPCTTFFCGLTTGTVEIHHVTNFYDLNQYEKITNLDKPILNLSNPLRVYYETTTPNGWKTANVLNSVKNDWDNQAIRGKLSKFSLKFPRFSNGDGQSDGVIFYSNNNRDDPRVTPKLNIDYLIP